MKENIITNQTVRRFEAHLKTEEKASATIEKYLRDITAFKEFQGSIPLSKDLLISYKRHLQEEGYAIKSINSVIASLNALLNFIGKQELKLKTIKLQRQIFCPEEKELSRGEYLRLLAAARDKGNTRLDLLIQTICGTGIRVSELRFITVEAVQRGEARVSLKGKTRDVFIVKPLQKRLLIYIKEQNLKSGSVFVTKSGKPISRSNIWREMKGLCQKAGVDSRKVFPHNLRHLFARTFYSIDKDIAKLADILGHSSIDTTRIYIMSTGEEHRRRMENMRLII